MKGGSLDENGVSWYSPHREAPVRLLSFSRVTSRFFIRTLFLAIHSFISPTSSANLDSFLTFFHSSHSSSKRKLSWLFILSNFSFGAYQFFFFFSSTPQNCFSPVFFCVVLRQPSEFVHSGPSPLCSLLGMAWQLLPVLHTHGA